MKWKTHYVQNCILTSQLWYLSVNFYHLSSEVSNDLNNFTEKPLFILIIIKMLPHIGSCFYVLVKVKCAIRGKKRTKEINMQEECKRKALAYFNC